MFIEVLGVVEFLGVCIYFKGLVPAPELSSIVY